MAGVRAFDMPSVPGAAWQPGRRYHRSMTVRLFLALILGGLMACHGAARAAEI